MFPYKKTFCCLLLDMSWPMYQSAGGWLCGEGRPWGVGGAPARGDWWLDLCLYDGTVNTGFYSISETACPGSLSLIDGFWFDCCGWGRYSWSDPGLRILLVFYSAISNRKTIQTSHPDVLSHSWKLRDGQYARAPSTEAYLRTSASWIFCIRARKKSSMHPLYDSPFVRTSRRLSSQRGTELYHQLFLFLPIVNLNLCSAAAGLKVRPNIW